MESINTIRKYYRTSENFHRYLINNEKRVKEIKKILANKKFFGKKVLDIACGGGILGFLLEKNKHDYTGIDINPDMILAAKNYANKSKSKNKFILADITNKKIKGRFDTFAFLGNALCHFTTNDYVKTLQNLKQNAKRGSYFILEYRDVVDLLFKRQWKKRIVERDKGKTIISLTTGVNMKTGEIFKKAFDKKGGNRINFVHAIWSPFILESIMKSSGWGLVKRVENRRWHGWIDIYKKI